MLWERETENKTGLPFIQKPASSAVGSHGSFLTLPTEKTYFSHIALHRCHESSGYGSRQNLDSVRSTERKVLAAKYEGHRWSWSQRLAAQTTKGPQTWQRRKTTLTGAYEYNLQVWSRSVACEARTRGSGQVLCAKNTFFSLSGKVLEHHRRKEARPLCGFQHHKGENLLYFPHNCRPNFLLGNLRHTFYLYTSDARSERSIK